MSAHRLPFDLAKMPVSEYKTSSDTNIVPNSWKIVSVTTTSATTLTLEAPAGPGVLVIVRLHEDGGDLTISSVKEINDTPFNTVTLDGHNEWVALMSAPDSAGDYRWMVIGHDGAAFS